MDNSFSSLISSAVSILVLLPQKPFLDQVAAGLSLYLSLADSKEATISCPSAMTVDLNRLIGVNKISQELGNKNLTIRFKNYAASDIERVSYDIENGEFRLVVIPKTGAVPVKKEQVEFSYLGVSADTVVLIGGANESHFPPLSLKELDGAKIIHIGARVLNTATKQIISFAQAGSSVSEVVARMIKENNLALDPDIATNLIAGIEEGSQNFKSPEVSPETFEIFAYLLRAGGRRGAISPRVDKEIFPPGAIPGEKIFPKEFPKDVSSTPPPKDWLEPKIFKGTSIS